MPKHEGLVWTFFNKVPVSDDTVGSKYKAGTCMFCGQNYVSNATRMAKHLVEKCTKCPQDVKAIFNTTPADDLEALSTVGKLSASSQSQIQQLTLKQDGPKSRSTVIATQHQTSMKWFVDTMPIQMKNEVNTAFARAVYASSMPLSITESEYWQDFFKILRPLWSPPTRFQLSNTLLDAEYKSVEAKITEKIVKADSLTVMSDGWTDINGNSLINILVATPEPVFFSAIESTEQAHTGQHIAHILGQTITQIGSDKVHAVVTDNAANMKLAWKMLKDRFPHLIIYGCLTHGINLIIKDIISLQTIQKQIHEVKDIIKFFRNTQLAKQVLKKIQLENGGKEMAILQPVDTRWGSHCAAINSLLRTKDHLQMAVLHREISSKITVVMRRNLLDDDYFWPMLQKLHDLIEPPSSLIKTIEGDCPNLSYFAISVKQLFVALQSNLFFLSAADEEALRDAFNRRKEFLFHPIQLVAHMLNPKLDNSQLSETEEQAALDMIAVQAKLMHLDCDKVFVDLGDFVSKSSIWASNFIWEAAKNMSPVAWWKVYCARRELTKLAVIVLNLPSTSAACERNWSAFSTVKTMKRNRLSQDRTKKLVAVKYNLNLLNKKQDDKGDKGYQQKTCSKGNSRNESGVHTPEFQESEDEVFMEEEWLDYDVLSDNE